MSEDADAESGGGAATTTDTEKEKEGVYETTPEGSNTSLPSANESEPEAEPQAHRNRAAGVQNAQEPTIEELLARGGGGGSTSTTHTQTPTSSSANNKNLISGVEA